MSEGGAVDGGVIVNPGLALMPEGGTGDVGDDSISDAAMLFCGNTCFMLEGDAGDGGFDSTSEMSIWDNPCPVPEGDVGDGGVNVEPGLALMPEGSAIGGEFGS